MKPRSSIFDSNAEQQIYTAMSGTWEPAFRLYPHIPFANLIELDQQRLSAAELSFLHKTSVDFVLTDLVGKPLLALEFDGLGGGYSRDGRYLGFTETPRDKNRPWKLDLKVRVAKDAKFPFVVIAYDEKRVVDEETNLLVLHGIVGSYISSRQVLPRVQELLSEHQERMREMSQAEIDDEVQDMVLADEIDADMEWNLISRRGVELESEVRRMDPTIAGGFRFLEDPPRPANCTPMTPGFDQEAFSRWWRNVERFGCEYSVETSRGTVTRAIWLRNYGGEGLSPFGGLQDLAQLVAMRATLDFLRGG